MRRGIVRLLVLLTLLGGLAFTVASFWPGEHSSLRISGLQFIVAALILRGLQRGDAMTAAHFTECDGNGSVTCWECGGAGGFHNCGDDCCPHLDPDAITDDCPTCEGLGDIRCPGCAEMATS